jgi:hypothetical protein
MIHANADFDFNGLTDFHPQAVQAGITAMLRGGTPVVADVEMICSGLSIPRLAHFGMHTHQFISDADVVLQAQQQDTTRAVQAMRKAHRLGLLARRHRGHWQCAHRTHRTGPADCRRGCAPGTGRGHARGLCVGGRVQRPDRQPARQCRGW